MKLYSRKDLSDFSCTAPFLNQWEMFHYAQMFPSIDPKQG